MARQSKNKSLKREEVALSKARKRLFLIPILALAIKVLILFRIQGVSFSVPDSTGLGSSLTNLLNSNLWPAHIWFGADGENYLRSLSELLAGGFLSAGGNLSYWPAGYPLMLWPLILISKSLFFSILGFAQSVLYAISCAYFVDELKLSRLSKFALPVALILTLNPTLALNTIAIGYELPAVSFLLISIAAMLRSLRVKRTAIFSSELLIASISLLFASLMQPRLLIIAVSILFIWGIAIYSPRRLALFLSISIAVVAIAPATLILRNYRANGYFAMSTNLGTTMNIGAGPNSTGGYTNKATGVDCPNNEDDAASRDAATVRCVLKWYLKNPTSSLKLAWNKSLYFWSPWFGPVANGTMARNPWRTIHPLAETIKSESGYKMVFGSSGKFISWTWVIFTLFTLFYGFVILWQAGNAERVLSLVALVTVILNWISSIATIGDNRFRIPTMGISLFLQTVGFVGLFLKRRRRFSGIPTPITWRGIYWKAPSQPDNLPS